ncbi:MAG: hypothetical protein AB8G26_16770, partial [Ilumatobacter sp.]
MFPFHDMHFLLDDHRRRIDEAERLALVVRLRRAQRAAWRARFGDEWRGRTSSRRQSASTPEPAAVVCSPN